MNSFPPDIRFRKPWRSYQQRVLNELKDHLDDNHLHIIAAPGSGKTVLGLEVLRRLNQPALILAPYRRDPGPVGRSVRQSVHGHGPECPRLDIEGYPQPAIHHRLDVPGPSQRLPG